MRGVLLGVLSGLAGCLAMSAVVQAAGPDPDNYPLRVHILQYNSHAPGPRESKAFTGMQDFIEGQGHADLFENGQPEGFQFRNSCTDKLAASDGYGTVPARWKKRGKSLEILVPQSGKPWNLDACELQVDMRPGLAYYWTEDTVVEESAANFKDWMVKHQYDPEKGLEQPIDSGPASGGSSSSNPEQPVQPAKSK